MKVTSFFWSNLFWLYLLYGLITWVVMRFIPRNKRQKILTSTLNESSKWRKIASVLSMVFRMGAILLSFFIPFARESWLLYIGIVVYMVGLVLSTLAMWQFSRAGIDEPIVSGIYKVSRHPMQVMYYIMVIGIGIATNSLIFRGVIIAYILTSYSMFSTQEKFCIEKYGNKYVQYMQSTPRVLFFNSNKNRKNRWM